MLRLASTALGSFFFQRGPSGCQLHLEPANLLVEFSLHRLLRMVVLAAVAGEHVGTLFQQLPFPLAALVGMKTMFARQLADGANRAAGTSSVGLWLLPTQGVPAPET